MKSKENTFVPNEIHFEIPYLFSIEFVWETVQQVLSDVLNEYVDYNVAYDTLSSSSSSISNLTDYTNQSSLINFSQYLMKKPPLRSQEIPYVFEFSQSEQFHTMTSYLQEQNRFVIKQEISTMKSGTNAYRQYVCKPNYRNIIVVEDILQRIIDDIDNNCQLHPTKRILDRLENIEKHTIYNLLSLRIEIYCSFIFVIFRYEIISKLNVCK